MYTKATISKLLESKPQAVISALRRVMSACGFCHKGYFFAKSLLSQVDAGKELTEAQLKAARDVLESYLPLLVRIANSKPRTEPVQNSKPCCAHCKQPAEKLYSHCGKQYCMECCPDGCPHCGALDCSYLYGADCPKLLNAMEEIRQEGADLRQQEEAHYEQEPDDELAYMRYMESLNERRYHDDDPPF